MTAWSGSSETLFLSCRHRHPHCVVTWQKERDRDAEKETASAQLSGASSYKDSKSYWIRALLTSFNFTSIKALSPNTFTLGVRPSTYIFWVGKQGGTLKDSIWFEQRKYRIWECDEGWGWKEGLVWTLFTLGNLENFTDLFIYLFILPLSQILISKKRALD